MRYNHLTFLKIGFVSHFFISHGFHRLPRLTRIDIDFETRVSQITQRVWPGVFSTKLVLQTWFVRQVFVSSTWQRCCPALSGVRPTLNINRPNKLLLFSIAFRNPPNRVADKSVSRTDERSLIIGGTCAIYVKNGMILTGLTGLNCCQ